MNKTSTAIFIVPLLTLSLLFLAGCEGHKEHKSSSTFTVTSPWRQEVEIKQEFVAQIRAIQHIEIRAFEKGYLQEIFVDEGQSIKKGQKMFQIMPLLMQAKFQQAKAKYDLSEIEYTNTRTLARKKVVSENELALAKARFDKARAELNLAQTHLNLTTITAPFDGIMDRFKVRLGSLVEEGALLTTLSDNSKLWVYFNVSERDYLNYMSMKKSAGGIPVQLVLANGKLFDQQGQIDTIEADFDNETGNVAFRATFPNPEGLLRHGETGNVIMKETIDDALVIPQKASFEVLDKRYVYVVDQKGVVSAREIQVDKEVPHLFVVKSGLSEKDTILLEGLGKVNRGQHIKVQRKDLKDVLKGLELAAN